MTEADPTPPSPVDFADPPVGEVALSFGFFDIPGFHAGMIGRYWDPISAEFPTVEHQGPYDMPVEPLEPTASPPPRVELLEGPVMPRIWLRSANGTQLIQLQQNWFGFNWQRAGGEEPYPRYPVVEEQFRRHANRFVSFVEEQGLGDVAVTQCEVTYVNHIPLPEPGLPAMREVLSIVTPATGKFLPPPLQQRINVAYLIHTDAGEPCGRLHVTANPGFRKSDGSPILSLTLTARGYPIGVGEKGVIEFLRLGRRWVVNGFVDVTTPKMHAEWGLK